MQHGLVYDYSERFVHLYTFGPSLFTGKERDNESGEFGFDMFGARYYGGRSIACQRFHISASSRLFLP